MEPLRDAIKTIPAQLVNPDPELAETQLPALDLWLQQNDCLEQNVDFKLCYTQTRLKLISAVYHLDAANDKVYGSQVVINSLTHSITSIVDGVQGSATFLTNPRKK